MRALGGESGESGESARSEEEAPAAPPAESESGGRAQKNAPGYGMNAAAAMMERHEKLASKLRGKRQT